MSHCWINILSIKCYFYKQTFYFNLAYFVYHFFSVIFYFKFLKINLTKIKTKISERKGELVLKENCYIFEWFCFQIKNNNKIEKFETVKNINYKTLKQNKSNLLDL